jgi:hypothetical protein
MFAIKNILMSGLAAGVLGLGATAAHADTYAPSPAGSGYTSAYTPGYGYYPAPAPVYAVPAPSYMPAPIYAAPVCEPPVVIYGPRVIYHEPVRVFRPLDRGRHEGFHFGFHFGFHR